MGLLDKMKKCFELKQNTPSPESIQKTCKRISRLEKQLEKNSDNPNFLIDLYGCYVEISNTTKKIECLEKISNLLPNDSYPLQQLADIYLNELGDMKQAKIYQNKANKATKSF